MNCWAIRSQCVYTCVCAPHKFRERVSTRRVFPRMLSPSPADTQMTFLWISYTSHDIYGDLVGDKSSAAKSWQISWVATCGGGSPSTHLGPAGSWQRGGTAAGPVYSAVGLPRSRGKRGRVQGLINHGCFGRDKQARPSRDAAAPAAGGGKGQRRGGGERRRCSGVCGKARGARGEETVDWHSRGYTITLALWFHICMAARACKSTFFVWPDANRAPDASAWTPKPFSSAVLCILKVDGELCARSWAWINPFLFLRRHARSSARRLNEVSLW